MAKLQISGVIPATVNTGSVLIVAGTRATKGKKIEAANKQRVVTIDELTVPNVPDKFKKLVLASLYEAAKQQLRDLWEETPAITETDSELFTVESLLLFAERAAESKRLTAVSVTEAIENFIETLDDSRRKLAGEICTSMAGAVRKGNEKQCISLAEKLALWIEENAEDDDYVIRTVQRRIAERGIELRTQRLAYDSAETF